MNPTDVVQVCNASQTACQWVSVSQLSSFPVLTVEDALTLSSAVWGLLALVWVLRRMRSSIV